MSFDKVLILDTQGQDEDLTEQTLLEQELQKDVALASWVQKRLLPPEYDSAEVQIRTIYKPYQLASGDFFDYRLLNNGNTLFGYVVDVMGHGVSTALITTALSVLFREASKRPGSLYERMAWVNEESHRYFADYSFAAGICFEFDLKRQMLTIIICGINKFIANCFLINGLVKLPGSFLGVTGALSFTEITLPIQQGDAFYFMTDGLYDLFEDQQELKVGDFSQTLEMLKELIQQKGGHDDVAAICLTIPEINSKMDSSITTRKNEYLKIRFQGHVGVCLIWPLVGNFIRQALGIDQNSLFEVAAIEAVNNAVEYGSMAGIEDTVSVRLRVIKKKWLCIRIKDNGPGFLGNQRLQTIKEKQHPFDDIPHGDGGRGLSFMVSASDFVKYNRMGNEVIIVKKINKC